MIRKLFLFSGVALIASLVCIAGAAALIRHQVDTTGWTWAMIKDGHHMRYTNGADAKVEPTVTRDLQWTGGDLLAVDFPAEVVYTQGVTASVSISGPQSLIDRIKLENGRLTRLDKGNKEVVRVSWTRDGWDTQSNDQEARITITTPSVKRFELTSDANLRIRGYDQPTLDVILSGSGSVDAVGKTQALKVNLSGYGNADLAALQAKDATVTVSGSGNADIFATGNAKIDISGSGNVDLATKPAKLDTTISGSGSVDQDGEDN
ncbi:GIN domain-containing protein [Asticcacaulis sp. 201]|uniref:GIN domain-containing protein n=1 Tax=Asticcacaulis sp. 201 TaxID=3028787 RepID=UPI0029162A2F|nr:DUF2807 domain-containing protein [Asticcacaulis sp. 201]MDV6332007.1 DUF2807 domain-containing protein [Asticcacaulis sp. 201]